MKREGQPWSAFLFLVTIILVVSVVALVASTQPPAPPVSGTSTTASTSKGSETVATSQTSTPSTVSRVADTQIAYAANVNLANSETTTTVTNNTDALCASFLQKSATMELLVVSDTTGMPVQQGTAAVSVAFRTGCNGIYPINATITLYFERVSEGSSGWFDFPKTSGAFNFTVGQAGRAYLFPAGSYPDSTTCVTLAVPSGMVTLTRYQFSNYDCAGNLGGWADKAIHACFGEVYLRVLSDSDSAPVAGAAVTTAYDFANTCDPPPEPGSQAFVGFTTTRSAEWYAFGDSSDSFSVDYGGQANSVVASQRAGSTCVTLHVPSGAVDTTYGAGCAADNTSQATSVGLSLPVITTGVYTFDSDVNSSNICNYSRATTMSIVSSIEGYPVFKALEGNQTYELDGAGCETAPGHFPTVDFRSADLAHPMQVTCPSGLKLTYYSTRIIGVELYVTATGYDLTHSTYDLRIDSSLPSCPAG